MSRRRSTPWTHRWSRPLIGGIAVLGALTTGYLTVTHQLGQSVACPTSGCESVLSSSYATLAGLPLSLFGFLAYTAMAVFALGPLALNPKKDKELRTKLEHWSWYLLFAGAVAMVVFSGYLMFLLTFKIQAVCLYCLASALFTLLMLVLVVIGREWPDMGQLFFTGIIVAVVALVGTLGVYAGTTTSTVQDPASEGMEIAITTTSSLAEVSLAEHLSKVGATMYGAYWCPHCHDQKQLFGKEAFNKVKYVECDPNGKNAQPDLCKAQNITSYPTWKVQGQELSGTQPLEQLAKASNYKGPQNFQNSPGSF